MYFQNLPIDLSLFLVKNFIQIWIQVIISVILIQYFIDIVKHY